MAFKRDCFDIATDRPSTKKKHVWNLVRVYLGRRRRWRKAVFAVCRTIRFGHAWDGRRLQCTQRLYHGLRVGPCIAIPGNAARTAVRRGRYRFGSRFKPGGSQRKRFSIRHRLLPSNRNGTVGHVRQSH